MATPEAKGAITPLPGRLPNGGRLAFRGGTAGGPLPQLRDRRSHHDHLPYPGSPRHIHPRRRHRCHQLSRPLAFRWPPPRRDLPGIDHRVTGLVVWRVTGREGSPNRDPLPRTPHHSCWYSDEGPDLGQLPATGSPTAQWRRGSPGGTTIFSTTFPCRKACSVIDCTHGGTRGLLGRGKMVQIGNSPVVTLWPNRSLNGVPAW